MSNFTILHLYPETLRLNGELGNITALVKRAESFGLSSKVSRLELGGKLPKTRPNLIFIGSGTLSATKLAAADLIDKDQEIHRWIAAGTKLLAVGSGFDLAAKELELPDGEFLQGLGLTNTSHRVTSTHLVGEVVLDSGLAGFINSNRLIIRADSKFALGKVVSSDEAKLVGYVDGYYDGKVMASNVQGPLLPMNPKLADQLITSIFPKLPKPKGLTLLNSLASKARGAISNRVNG